MQKSDFFYHLPEELIAQTPLERRDASRLLCIDKATGNISQNRFSDLPKLLRPGDLLVMNDSKVIPARLLGVKIPSGAAIEFLLLEQKELNVWEIMVRPGRKAPVGARFSFGGGLLTGEIVAVADGGNRLAIFEHQGDFFSVLEQIGKMPLPPYITEKLKDNDRYQTVYANEPGSAAAPTAGLHFTPELIEEIQNRGVNTAFVTLHVGAGTFRPVKAENINEHTMHVERYQIPKETADAINRAKASGGRVIAVGTTSCRTLETAAHDGEIKETAGNTGIFITPGYKFRAIQGLITNFHLPESTLIMLVAAFAGYEITMSAYRAAVMEKYRFFSFGDAMMIL
ncbi:MAG: tRNA preQ1(34) S-adenosylmethionine ribosyltransferase-isomerase QueA [Oscillospiraceae bacterium]|nr:tRNA preQ1(34) S-adenosylmethionine ribosyltransferase-isomerase QueA [Oscillospiraceae bacterium]